MSEFSAVNRSDGDAIERMRLARSAKRTSLHDIMVSVREGYFGTPMDRKLEGLVDEMIDTFLLTTDAAGAADKGQLGRLAEGTVLVVVGESGMGKSSLLLRCFNKRAEFAGFSRTSENSSPLLSITLPSPCTLRLLGLEIIKALGYCTSRYLKENVVWDMVRTMLPDRGIHFIHLDEVQHIMASRSQPEIVKIRNTLKNLLQQPGWPISLILSGLPEIATLIEWDTQVRRRSRFLRFDHLTLERDAIPLRRMIDFFACEKAQLRPSSVSDEVLGRLLHASLHRFGMAVEMTQAAIKEALVAGADSLAVSHFADAFANKTGCQSGDNVFDAKGDYSLIDVEHLLYQDDVDHHNELHDEPVSSSPKRRRLPSKAAGKSK